MKHPFPPSTSKFFWARLEAHTSSRAVHIRTHERDMLKTKTFAWFLNAGWKPAEIVRLLEGV
jgi:hypothetical protein